MVFACRAIAKANAKQKLPSNFKTKITEMPAEFVTNKGKSWLDERRYRCMGLLASQSRQPIKGRAAVFLQKTRENDQKTRWRKG